jgi:hypothetical protein
VAEPFSHSFVANWRPTLRYHQHRLDVLADLESKGWLKQFFVADDRIGARTNVTELTLRDSGVDLHSRLGLLSDEVAHILRSVLVAASPQEYEFSLLYQFLVPITAQSYEEARLTALNYLSAGFLGDLGVVDFAMLLDGRRSEMDWHCEFGIVSEEEIAARVRREVGRMRGKGSPPWDPATALSDTAVAFFADFVWHSAQHSDPDALGFDALTEQVQTLADAAIEIVTELHGLVCSGQLQPMAGGSDYE